MVNFPIKTMAIIQSTVSTVVQGVAFIGGAAFLVSSANNLYNLFRLREDIRRPSGPSRLATGAIIHLTVGRYAIVRQPAHAVLIARRVIDCGIQLDRTADAAKFCFDEIFSPPILHITETEQLNTSKWTHLTGCQGITKRISRIGSSILSLISSLFHLTMAFYDLYVARPTNRNIEDEATVLLQVNIDYLLRLYTNNREQLADELRRNIKRLRLNIDPDPFIETLTSGLDSINSAHQATERVRNIGLNFFREGWETFYHCVFE